MTTRTTGALSAALFLLIFGAVLRYAVNATVTGIDLQVVGTILIIGGGAALIWAAIEALAGPPTERRVITERTVTDNPLVRERERIDL